MSEQLDTWQRGLRDGVDTGAPPNASITAPERAR